MVGEKDICYVIHGYILMPYIKCTIIIRRYIYEINIVILYNRSMQSESMYFIHTERSNINGFVTRRIYFNEAETRR